MNKLSSLFINGLNFNLPQKIILQQVRTTFILKRRFAPPLLRQGPDAKRRLKSKHFIYDMVKNTCTDKKPEIPLILTQFVQSYGNRGEKIYVKPTKAYEKFLLPKLAVYATPENEEKYKSSETNEIVCSSPTAQITATRLSGYRLIVNMNQENSWTLKPWHIRTSLRKAGMHVPEGNIEIPRIISGPNMDYENKEFYVIITINNFEKVKVRCRLQHCATSIVDPIASDPDYNTKEVPPIFPEDAETLNEMPLKTEIKFTI